jgi:hypothetical protein
MLKRQFPRSPLVNSQTLRAQIRKLVPTMVVSAAFMLKLLVCSGLLMHVVRTSCSGLNDCNGHGLCSISSRCECFEGWGAKSDITSYRSPDCSARVCPAGLSWGDVPRRDGTAHNSAECSDRGICDRILGRCVCAAGFEGAACQRMKCPNDCSGHGTCTTMERLASKLDSFPLSDIRTTYESSNVSECGRFSYDIPI